MTTSSSLNSPSLPPSSGGNARAARILVPVVAVLGVTVLALAAALVAQRSDAVSGGSSAAAELAAPTALSAPAATANVPAPQAVVQAPRVVTPQPVAAPRTSAAQTAPNAAPAPVQASAPACTSCGVIESVAAVQRAAPTSGVGAVAGGVVGGLLGNQLGGGSGRTAMTVLGAVGGGFAGNAVEKNMKKHTVYQVHVRMNDGTQRTFEQASAPAVGSAVVVEGNRMRLASSTG